MIRRLIGFIAVGAVGFIADGGILWLLLPYLGSSWGRAISFSIAVTVTWALNRAVTFRDRASKTGRAVELGRYVLSQTIGAVINVGLYAFSMFANTWMAERPLAAFAVGSAGGLIVNFTLAQWFVFRDVGRAEPAVRDKTASSSR
jgi:putative flippase GtrA